VVHVCGRYRSREYSGTAHRIAVGVSHTADQYSVRNRVGLFETASEERRSSLSLRPQELRIRKFPPFESVR